MPLSDVSEGYSLAVTEVEDRAAPREGQARRHRWYWAAAVLVMVLVGAGIPTAIWFAHWRSSLHQLIDYPTYGVGGPFRADATLYFGGNIWPADAAGEPALGSEQSIHISAAQPIVQNNTADARVSVWECVRKSRGDDTIASGIGDARRICARLAPFAPGNFRVGGDANDDDLVVAVTAAHPGRVRVAGLLVRYSSGLRHGTQHVGVKIDLRLTN